MKKPNYTQVSNDFIELIPQLSGAAVKLFIAISRKTIGYHKDCEILSQVDLSERTGLSRNSVKNGVAELLDQNLIKSWSKGIGKNTRTFYELDFSEKQLEEEEFYSEEESPNRPFVSKTDIKGDFNGSKIDPLNGSNGSKIDPLNGSNGSKIDPFINKRNLKENNIKKFSASTPEPKIDSNKFFSIDQAISCWNEYSRNNTGIIRYRYTSANLRNPSEVLKVLEHYSAAEFREAVNNYAVITGDNRYKAFPEYTGFEGFAATGVEKYINEARPFDRCRVSGEVGSGETAEERMQRLGLG